MAGPAGRLSVFAHPMLVVAMASLTSALIIPRILCLCLLFCWQHALDESGGLLAVCGQHVVGR